MYDMNIATEPKLSGKPIDDKPRKRTRPVLWFFIVGCLLAALVGGLRKESFSRKVARALIESAPESISFSMPTAHWRMRRRASFLLIS